MRAAQWRRANPDGPLQQLGGHQCRQWLTTFFGGSPFWIDRHADSAQHSRLTEMHLYRRGKDRTDARLDRMPSMPVVGTIAS